MSVTKTYSYVVGGSPGSVDVTVDINLCNIVPTGPGLENLAGTLTIDVSLSASVPFGLILEFDTAFEQLNGFGLFTQNYKTYLTIPPDVTSYTITGVQCYSEIADPYERKTFDYTFADQENPQEVGSIISVTLVSTTDATCHGLPTGTILINAVGGTGNYTYVWSDGGPSTPNRAGVPAGTYSVTVTDTAANETTLTDIVVGQPTQIQLNPTITPNTCFGGSNGGVTIAPSGGSAPYTVAWSDGGSGLTRNSLAAGNYQVTVTDAVGCSRIFTVAIPQPAQIQITVNKSGKNVTNEVSGGTPPYTYLWSDGITLRDRNNIPNGTYTFTVTDANGCQQSTFIFIQDFKFYFSKNPIWLRLQADDLESKPNLSFVCEVHLEDEFGSDSFEQRYSSEQPAKADGSTDFNMQQVLNAFLDSLVPTFGDNQIRIVSEAYKRFYLSYFEKYGNPPAPDDTTVNETFFVLFGGLSEQEFAKQVFFESYLDDQKPFLTWSPPRQAIADDQHAYLHFVVNNPIYTALTLRAAIVYTDGTSATTSPLTITGVEPFQVLRFPAGIAQLGLAALNPSKTIASYTLTLINGTEVLSEPKEYYVLPARRHYKKLLYLNSLGGWDQVLCTGRGKKSIRTQEETISRDLPVAFAYSDSELETVSKSGSLSGQYVIATLNGYQREHLIDLAISEKVYEQTASGYLPVKVKFDFDPADDFENLDEISLEILYPTIRRYTPEL